MEPIYLEPDEEITSVIDKLTAAGGGKVAIVVPKNSTLFQSLVNLKLLAKQAKESNKVVTLITGNKVGQRLASQVGIESYANLGTVKAAPLPESTATTVPASVAEETLTDGTPVHRYIPPKTGEAEPADAPETVPEPTPEESAEPPTPVEAEPVPTSDLPPEPSAPITPKTEGASDDLPPIVSRVGRPKREFHFEIPWKSVIAAAILLLLAFGVTYVLLPKATVTVTLPATAVSAAVTLEARTVSDGGDKTLVGNLLTVEKSLTKQITATGKKDIGTKATGTLAFKNCEDTNSYLVQAGRQIRTSDLSKVFLANSSVTIPPGSFSAGGTVCNSTSVNISVTAEHPGEAYNVTSNGFVITGMSTRISGSGTTSGGSTKQVTVLSQEDVDKAFAELEKQATEESTTELKAKAESQTLLDGSLIQTVKERQADKNVGDQVDTATARYALELAVIVFDGQVAEEHLTSALNAQLEEGQRLEMPTETPARLSFKSYSDDKSVMSFEVSGSGYGVPDVGKDELAKAVRHKSKAAAADELKNKYGAEEVLVDIRPSWWFGRLPILSQAISVEYGFSESLEPLGTEAEPAAE
jgi:hypothetical protein